MKNILIFVHPSKEFYNQYGPLVKVQIDNSLLMGWEKKDILLFTNFDYEYNGVKSIVVPDSLYCEHRRRASKIDVICYLFEEGMINDLCWFHDFDAYQLEYFTEIEKELEGVDVGFTDYGYSDYWNTGSFFFKPESKDVFLLIREKVYKFRCNEEQALNLLTKKNIKNINSRYKRLNNTYNLGRLREKDYCVSYERAIKPVKVLHFLPERKEVFDGVKDLMSDELLSIFKSHGYE